MKSDSLPIYNNCPECGAKPGEWCSTMEGRALALAHRKRAPAPYPWIRRKCKLCKGHGYREPATLNGKRTECTECGGKGHHLEERQK